MKDVIESRSARALRGAARVPGDKSISHRALLLGTLAAGETRITGLLEGEDVLASAAAMRALGAEFERKGEGDWRVWGPGLGALAEPEDVIDCGNAGTLCRLLLGMLASHRVKAVVKGDASLSARPMDRVIAPLSQMGAAFVSRRGRLPITITGALPALAIRYELPVASAQVKSAVLLAALNTPGRTTVVEHAATRDHSERMLRAFGADIEIEDMADGEAIGVTGEVELEPTAVTVPGDISSAAFPLVAAALIEGSAVTITGVGVNPRRAGLIAMLREMGAEIALENRRDLAGEPVADLHVKGRALTAVDVPPEIAPSMIDEFPLAFVAAAAAEGVSRFSGLAELRVKESDRIAVMAEGLAACGVEVTEQEDGLTIGGRGPDGLKGGATIASRFDHRIAMAFAVLGQIAKQPVRIEQADAIATSFPDFVALMRRLGCEIS